MANQNSASIGLDLGGTRLKYGLVGGHGEVLHSGARLITVTSGRQEILETMISAARECVEWSQKLKVTVNAIGAGCPGNIDVRTGLSLGPTPHLPDWEGAPVGPTLESLGYPVVVDNDANMAAYGEFKVGAGIGHEILVAITLGTGIGGGIILDGQIFRGSNYNGAELGHVCVEADGRSCACGNRGCMERYAGGKSIVEDVRTLIEEGRSSSLSELPNITPRDIFNAAAQDDPLAGEVVAQMIKYLAAGLSSVVNVLNPDIIIIGGGIADAGQHFLDQIDRKLRDRVMKPVKDSFKLERAALGNQAGFIGAALCAMELGRRHA